MHNAPDFKEIQNAYTAVTKNIKYFKCNEKL